MRIDGNYLVILARGKKGTDDKMKKIQVVAENHEGQRMDSALVELLPEYSRTAIQRWVKEGQVSVGAKVVKSS